MESTMRGVGLRGDTTACSRSTSRRRRSASGRRSPTASCGRSTTSASDVSSDWTPGSSYAGRPSRAWHRRSPRARTSRSIRRAGSCRRFNALWSDDVKAEGTSRVTWEIEPVGDSCRLTVTHDQLRDGRQRRALRRLADDPLRPEDAAGDRRAADHARLAEIRGGGGLGRQRQPGVERRVDPAGVESVRCAVLGARAVAVELRRGARRARAGGAAGRRARRRPPPRRCPPGTARRGRRRSDRGRAGRARRRAGRGRGTQR